MVISFKIPLSTSQRTEMRDITSLVRERLEASGMQNGLCTVFVPHTTAGITINENADPAVQADILAQMNKRIPFKDGYAHAEGNSAAHIKASLMGSSVNVLIEGGELVLGTWQGVYFCEFDGPRSRNIHVQCTGDH